MKNKKMNKFRWMYYKMMYQKNFDIFTHDYLIFVSDYCPNFVENNTIVSERFYKFYMERISWDFLHKCKEAK